MSTTYDWSSVLGPNGAISNYLQSMLFQKQLGGMFGQEQLPGAPSMQAQAQLPQQQMPGATMPAPSANAGPSNFPWRMKGIQGGPITVGGGPIDVSTPAIAPQTTYSGPVGQALGDQQSSALLPLFQALGPRALPLLMQTAQGAMQHKQDIEDRRITPLSSQEAQAAGLRAGGVYGRDVSGNLSTIQASDMHSPGAMQQQQDEAAFTNQLPMTPAQKAADERARAAQGETARHNQAVESQGDVPPDPNTVKYWAQSVAAGAPMPTLGMGKQAAAYRQAILKEVATLNGGQGMTGADQNANTATTKANTSSLGKITPLRAATEAYEGTMLQNMDLAKSMIAKGAGTTGVPVLNRWQNYIKGSYAGDPDVAAFQTAIQTVKNEYAKIQSGSIGNAPVTDSARREAEHMLDPSQTPAQLMANFNYMVQETGNRTRALRTQEQALRSGLSGHSDTPNMPANNARPDPLGIR